MLDHVTVELVEQDALDGRERRRIVVDLRRPEEAALAGMLVGDEHPVEVLRVQEHYARSFGHGHRGTTS